MEASDPISSKQKNDNIRANLEGHTGVTGVYADTMKQVLNGEISLEEAIEATKQDYNQGMK